MKAASDISPDVTNLKPCDHQAFFEALDSQDSPAEALRAAFRRRNDCPEDLHDIK
jgi:uncharacterized protein (DUF1778 family)